MPLASGEIAEDLASYFVQSEQIPSAVSLGVFVTPDHTVAAAGGFLVQFHADIDTDLVVHVEQALGAVPPVTTLVREGYGPQDILHRAVGGLDLEVVKHRQSRLALRLFPGSRRSRPPRLGPAAT